MLLLFIVDGYFVVWLYVVLFWFVSVDSCCVVRSCWQRAIFDRFDFPRGTDEQLHVAKSAWEDDDINPDTLPSSTQSHSHSNTNTTSHPGINHLLFGVDQLLSTTEEVAETPTIVYWIIDKRFPSSCRKPDIKIMRVAFILLAIAAAASVADLSTAQEYQDYADGYEQDNLYQDYAARQQGKEVGGGWVSTPYLTSEWWIILHFLSANQLCTIFISSSAKLHTLKLDT